MAVIEGYRFPTDPEAQRRDMLALVVVQGRDGPRAFLDNVSSALSRAVPAGGVLDDPDIDSVSSEDINAVAAEIVARAEAPML